MTAAPLQGRVALVTGAARGIGAGIAHGLAERGADVALCDLPARSDAHASYALAGSAELDEAIARADAAGPGRALGLPCDVTRANQVDALVEKTLATFGRLDLVVNNAGIVHMAPVEEIPEEQWERLFAVNVKGVFLVSRAALGALAETGGSIVNVASVAGKRGYAFGTAYCSSKFAVVGFTQALAMEVAGRGVRVNAVCPGVVPSAMWSDHITREERGGDAAYQALVHRNVPLGREQTAADVAEAVAYLATAPNVTGVALNVAGGMEVW